MFILVYRVQSGLFRSPLQFRGRQLYKTCQTVVEANRLLVATG